MPLTDVRMIHCGPRRFYLECKDAQGKVTISANTKRIREVIAERVRIGDTFHPDTLAAFPWIAELCAERQES